MKNNLNTLQGLDNKHWKCRENFETAGFGMSSLKFQNFIR